MYGLSAEDRRIQDTAREFVDSVIPLEVEAELAGGMLPKEVTAEHHARAIELGLYAHQHADVGRRPGMHGAAAGAGAGAVRAGRPTGWPG